MTARAAVVVLGAGSGARVGAEVNKVLLDLAGRPVLAHSVRTALGVPGVVRVLVVVRPGEETAVSVALGPHLEETEEVLLVPGGRERHDSERAALRALADQVAAGEIDVIAIHDGARPLATAALFAAVIEAAAVHGGAIPVVPAPALLTAEGRPAPPGLATVQTPQAFRAGPLLEAYDAADRDGFAGTDTASFLERYRPDLDVAAVDSTPRNLKVTFAEDLTAAARLIGG